MMTVGGTKRKELTAVKAYDLMSECSSENGGSASMRLDLVLIDDHDSVLDNRNERSLLLVVLRNDEADAKLPDEKVDAVVPRLTAAAFCCCC